MSNEVGSGSDVGRIRRAWHKARNRKVVWENVKDMEGKVVERVKKVTMSPGLSLKVWARKQIADNTSEASLAVAWFESRKLGAALERDAKATRLEQRGAVIRETGRATKAARRSKKSTDKKKSVETV